MNPHFLFPIPDINAVALLPIIFVVLTGIAALVIEMIRPKHNNDLIVGISLVGLVLAGLSAGYNLTLGQFSAFSNTYVVDRFGSLMQFAC